ncbi:MAG: YkgJ family cysteine cluster protein [Desulfobacterota bacterium]|nr:YkgJ family cysteine cluster protein [Thermodesulfobacteriota bacterium]
MGVAKIITISIETPDGKLPPARVAIPDLPLGLADLVPPMQKLCDGIVGLALQRERKNGETISCHKGCEKGLCCCQLVPLSPPEVFFLNDFLKGLPLEKKVKIEAAFQKIREVMDQRGVTEKIRNIESTDEHQVIAYEYFRMGLPCPFLDEGACSIYPIRPFACREYNILSPSTLCADPFKKGIRKVKIPRSMTTATARLAAELNQTAPVLIPMPFALEWARENAPFGNRRWSGIWLFERMMEFATGKEV